MEPRISGYITANTGFVLNVVDNAMLMSTIGIGCKAEKNNYYGKAEAGYGKSTYVKTEIGKDFTFGESRFGMNTSIAGQYIVENTKRDYYKNVRKNGENSPEWKPNDAKGYAQAKLTYKVPVFEASIGVRAGVMSSTQPSLEGITLADIGETSGTEYAGRTTKAYITPTVELEAGKKFKFCLNASFDEVSIGGKFCF